MYIHRLKSASGIVDTEVERVGLGGVRDGEVEGMWILGEPTVLALFQSLISPCKLL